MPTRADWEAASPKCPQMLVRKPVAAPTGAQRIVVGGTAARCFRPLYFNVARQEWCCPQHGPVIQARLAAAQRMAAESEAA